MKKRFQILGLLLLTSTTLFFACSDDDKPELPPEKVVLFADNSMKEAMVENSSINTNKDDEIQEKEAAAFTGKIDVSGRGISNLKGLEAFINITELDCSDNNLTSLDLTKNTKLIAVYCQKNKISTITTKSKVATKKDTTSKTKSVKIAANTLLKIFNCSNNQLTTIDVAANEKLEFFNCANNQLSDLNISKNIALKELDCAFNQIPALDLSQHINLIKLNTSNNEALKDLNIANNNNGKLKAMDATKTPKLTVIFVDKATVKNPPKEWKKDNDCYYYAKEDFYINFKDQNLKNALVENTQINTDGDKEISVIEAKNYVGIIDINNKEIADLGGLQFFVNITELKCNDNKIEKINVTPFTQLVRLECMNNPISKLDVTKNEKLITLYCSHCKLNDIDLSNNAELFELDITANPLVGIDLSKNTKLSAISVSETPITILTLDAAPQLSQLHCDKTGIATLDVSMLPNLNVVFASNNTNLEAINLANGNNKNMIGDDNNPVVNITNNPKLSCIQVDKDILKNIPKGWKKDKDATYSDDCASQDDNAIVNIPDANFKKILVNQGKEGSNKTTHFNQIDRKNKKGLLGKNRKNRFRAKPMDEPDIKVGIIDTNNDGEIQVGEAKAYTGIIQIFTWKNTPENEKVADLTGIEAFINLRELDCSGGSKWDEQKQKEIGCGIIKNLDISKNTKLEVLICDCNQITTLDVSNNKILKRLECYNNKIETIDVAKHTELLRLSVGQSTLKTLILPKNNKLKLLDFEDSPHLENIDISNCINLETLYCDNSNLKSIDVSNLKKLTDLSCQKNNLTNLDLSQNKELQILYCDKNQLKSLNISGLDKLYDLDCSNNQLTKLDVSKNKSLYSLYCSKNQLKELNVSQNKKLSSLKCNSNQLKQLNVSKCTNLNSLDCTDNPELTCIQVSQEQLDNANKIWEKDDTARYSKNCGENGESIVNIPDANFKKILVNQGKAGSNAARFNRINRTNKKDLLGKETNQMEMFEAMPMEESEIKVGIIDTNNDGEIQVSEAEAYTGAIRFYTHSNTPENKKVADLTGIEAFVNLRELKCEASNKWDEQKQKRVGCGIIKR